MRHLVFPLLFLVALGETAFVAADEKSGEASNRGQVLRFLKQHVIGKTVSTPRTTFKLDDNKIEGESEDRTTFNNLNVTADGFSFDIVTVTKESRHDLDKEGKHVGPARDMGGTSVTRYEFGERASTKKLTGTIRTVSTTTKYPNQDGTVILVMRVKVADGKLSWLETQPGYGDYSAAQGKYKPGSYDGRYTFSIADGKLRTEFAFTRFNVDPNTLQRTPEKNKVAPFVSKEIDRN